jgi:hypothetical protein
MPKLSSRPKSQSILIKTNLQLGEAKIVLAKGLIIRSWIQAGGKNQKYYQISSESQFLKAPPTRIDHSPPEKQTCQMKDMQLRPPTIVDLELEPDGELLIRTTRANGLRMEPT